VISSDPSPLYFFQKDCLERARRIEAQMCRRMRRDIEIALLFGSEENYKAVVREKWARFSMRLKGPACCDPLGLFDRPTRKRGYARRPPELGR